MTNNVIELDPLRTAPLEPSDGDDRNGFWISPFEVPRKIFLHCGSGRSDILSVRFDYPGGETGDTRGDLDSRNDPEVLIRSGRYTGKILELNFGRPISMGELASIGERLLERSVFFKMKATTFNYRMIAAIFRDWNNVVQPID
jgi:hypothetical protein